MVVVVLSRMRFLREMLLWTLNSDRGIKAFDAAEALDMSAWDRSPDLAIVDSAHPNAFQLTFGLRARYPCINIVVLASRDSEEDFLAWADIGIAGYLELDTSAEDLVSAMWRAGAGEIVCPPRLSALPLNRGTPQSSPRFSQVSVTGLTGRERQVLALLSEGLSNKLIARRLFIAEATVKNHVHSILEKWDVRSRGEVAAKYRQSLQCYHIHSHLDDLRSPPPRLSGPLAWRGTADFLQDGRQRATLTSER